MYNDQVAVVPQDFKAPFGTVGKFLIKTLKQYSHISDVNIKIDDICRKMEIENLLDRKMRDLSPGQLRWVVLATNIAADTKVLLIDEIEQHLSRSNLNQLVKLLYRKRYDKVLFSTRLISCHTNIRVFFISLSFIFSKNFSKFLKSDEIARHSSEPVYLH